jgi:uncharacterized paraquat-inducible protein A
VENAVALMTDDSEETVNAQLVTKGLARVAKWVSVDVFVIGVVDGNAVVKLATALDAGRGSSSQNSL